MERIRYHVPEDGDDAAHPNVFELVSEGAVRVGDVRRHFPLPGRFHLRFRRRVAGLEVWADASFANELYPGSPLLAKSRTGLLVLSFGALLYATSVRQTAVALSTCEAETSAHALATRVAIPIRLTLVALRCYRLPRPVAIHCDNTAVLALIKRRHVNSRLRHYRVNIAFVFHAIELGLTTVRYCKTTHMRADFLTKALPVGAFRANAALVYPDYEYAPL